MKKWIYPAAALILCILITLIPARRREESRDVWSAYGKCVVLDAGHGGIDGGASGKSGVTERELNLAIAQKLELLFGLCGIESVMTRKTDASIDDGTGATIAARKSADMKKRVEIANAEGSILVSIHMNSFTSSRYRGAQVFYSKNSPDSQVLAECLQKHIRTGLDPENAREVKKAPDSIYIMKHVMTPAVIVECGFLSNPAEEAKLRDDGYQRQICVSICSGTLEYLVGA